jgi:hypothetical protein
VAAGIFLGITALLTFVFSGLTLFDLVALVIEMGIFGLVGLIALYLIFTGFVAQTLAALIGGRWLLARIKPEWAASHVGALAVGLILLGLLAAIPFLGVAVSLLISLVGLGALWQWGQARLAPVLENI